MLTRPRSSGRGTKPKRPATRHAGHPMEGRSAFLFRQKALPFEELPEDGNDVIGLRFPEFRMAADEKTVLLREGCHRVRSGDIAKELFIHRLRQERIQGACLHVPGLKEVRKFVPVKLPAPDRDREHHEGMLRMRRPPWQLEILRERGKPFQKAVGVLLSGCKVLVKTAKFGDAERSADFGRPIVESGGHELE